MGIWTGQFARAVLCGLALQCGAWATPASAQTLYELLSRISTDHNRVQAARADVDASRHREREAEGAFFPTVNLRSSYGYERVENRLGTADTSMPPREGGLAVNQLLTDFGFTDANVSRARLTRRQAETTFDGAQQQILLDGVAAWLNLRRAREVLDYARQSEANIRRQADLEEARVQRGGGLSTDALQARGQLIGAQARRVRAEGAELTARNRFRNIFGAGAVMPQGGTAPAVPGGALPASLNDAILMALQNNPQLKAAGIGAEVAREQIRATTARSYAPRLELVGELAHKKDYDGTIGPRRDQELRAQMTFPFNLGLTAINSIEAARSDYTAVSRRVADSKDAVEEVVRNAWQNLLTSRETAAYLRSQAGISAEFLELARRERTLGTRSLLDVLNGETALINALADAVSAETDVSIAGFVLLAAMGRLDLAAFR